MGTRIPEGRPEKSHTDKSGRPVLSRQKAETPNTEKSAAGSSTDKKTQNVKSETGPQDFKNLSVNAQAAPGGKKPGPAVNAGFSSKTVFGSRENRFIESNLPFSSTTLPNTPVEKTAGTETVFARELFKQIAGALGFPQDNLSVTLIAFLRFFSLSPNPVSIKNLRRKVLSSQKTSSSDGAKEKAALPEGNLVRPLASSRTRRQVEAKALALVSALDKGVDLSPEALERYVRYCDPMVFAEDEEGAVAIPVSPDSEERREEPPNAEELRSIAQEQSPKDGFLDILNSLPGKNGKYWIVVPFKINVGGTVLKVFLRLLKREPLCPGEAEYAIIDIAGPKRQWRYSLERKDKKLRADIQVYPGISAGALKFLSKEAELFFGKEAAGFEEIKVENGERMPSWMEKLCNENLPSIDEEV